MLLGTVRVGCIWKSILKVKYRIAFSLLIFIHRLLTILLKTGAKSDKNWHLVCGIAAWFIWKWRNLEIVYTNVSYSSRTRNIIFDFVQDVIQADLILDCLLVQKKAIKVNISWNPPMADWDKANIDEAFKCNPSFISWGGVIRNTLGGWLGGFVRNLGICSSFHCKIVGRYGGSQAGLENGF